MDFENYLPDTVFEFLKKIPAGQTIKIGEYVKDPQQFVLTVKTLMEQGQVNKHRYIFHRSESCLQKLMMSYNPNWGMETNILYFLHHYFPIGCVAKTSQITNHPREFNAAKAYLYDYDMISVNDFGIFDEEYFWSRKAFEFDPELTYLHNVALFLVYELTQGSVVDIRKVAKDPNVFIDAVEALVSKRVIENDYYFSKNNIYLIKRGDFKYNFRQNYEDNVLSLLFGMPKGCRWEIRRIIGSQKKFSEVVNKFIDEGLISKTEFKLSENGIYIIRRNGV